MKDTVTRTLYLVKIVPTIDLTSYKLSLRFSKSSEVALLSRNKCQHLILAHQYVQRFRGI